VRHQANQYLVDVDGNEFFLVFAEPCQDTVARRQFADHGKAGIAGFIMDAIAGCQCRQVLAGDGA
jgi:hypothetical protein